MVFRFQYQHNCATPKLQNLSYVCSPTKPASSIEKIHKGFIQIHLSFLSLSTCFHSSLDEDVDSRRWFHLAAHQPSAPSWRAEQTVCVCLYETMNTEVLTTEQYLLSPPLSFLSMERKYDKTPPLNPHSLSLLHAFLFFYLSASLCLLPSFLTLKPFTSCHGPQTHRTKWLCIRFSFFL